MPVEVTVRSRRRRIDRPVLAALVSRLLAATGVPAESAVGLVLVSDRIMAGLNRKAMGHRGTTDVIAFPIDERFDPGDPAPCLGDVVVSLDRAEEEGRARGHGPDEELLTYVVHGLLHLQGHDDIDPAARRRMEAATNRLVRRFRGAPTGVAW